jgi:hypothetical protein
VLGPVGDSASATLTDAPPPVESQAREPGQLLAEQVDPGLDLTVANNATLMIGRTATRLAVRGEGLLQVNQTATVQDLELAHPLKLRLYEHAVVTGATGQVVLQLAANAQLVGSERSGLELTDIAPTPFTDPAQALGGAALENIKIPMNARGRQQLALLEHVAHFTPYVRDLPMIRIREWRYRRPFARKRWPTKLEQAQLSGEYEYVKTLARLAAEKGAPGSVRTKLAWATYRMRNLAAGSPVERIALSAYRVIGYGERAIPAVATWLLAAVVAIPIARGIHPDLSVRGLREFGEQWGHYVLSPLHLLRLGGGDDNPGTRELIARILVAAPFVTAVLAARNYVKADRNAP